MEHFFQQFQRNGQYHFDLLLEQILLASAGRFTFIFGCCLKNRHDLMI